MNIYTRAKRKLRRESLEFIWKQNLLHHFHKPKNNRVVMYHGIDEVSSTRFNLRFCARECFSEQVEYMKQHFNIVQLQDYFSGNYSSEKPALALTFDDGYSNWLSHALPVVEKHQVPVTFFVTSARASGEKILWADLSDIFKNVSDKDLNFLEYEFRKENGRYVCKNSGLELKELLNKSGWPVISAAMSAMMELLDDKTLEEASTYWQLLSDSEIKALSESDFVEIGSHSRYHTSLGAVSLGEAEAELQHSKDYLEDLLNRKIESLAYPSGSYTRELIGAAREMGFKHQLAVDYMYPEDATDERIIDRIGLYSHMTCGEQMLELE